MVASLAPAPDLVWFRGPDAIRFLNDLISQEIGDLSPGTVTRSLLLGPQGKLQFILWVLRGEEEVALATEDGRGEELAAGLGRFRIRVKVDIEPETRPMWLVVGDDTVEPRTWIDDGKQLRADISWPMSRRELRVGGPKPDLPELGRHDVDALRIANGEPLMGIDVDETTIPQETGLVPATISFTKGCFLGQELVARLDSRGGRVNNHLRLLEFSRDGVEVGTELTTPERTVGRVSTVAGTAGLALVWREVEPGSTVLAGEVETSTLPLPQKTAGSFTAS
ncbi:MAG: hypothetical protein OEM32_05720 [Acidimicrobiia bacterium]|nr:hypothetical protein [Acidimicrobiia bacterium]